MIDENVCVFRLCVSWRPSCNFIALLWCGVECRALLHSELLRSNFIAGQLDCWLGESGVAGLARSGREGQSVLGLTENKVIVP